MLVNEVEVENFKSIKHVKLKCKRINIFIGEPNTGKSNLIEAIVGLPSLFYYNPSRFGNDPKSFIRFDKISSIYYDNNLEDEIKILANIEDGLSFKILISFRDGHYYCNAQASNWQLNISFPPSYTSKQPIDEVSKYFKFYRFIHTKFDRRESEFLLPSNGRNFPSVYATNKTLKSVFRELFKKFGLKLLRDPESNDIKVVKEMEGDLIVYPYQSISDTFKRIMFYLSAILTNENSIIAMEEPEAHSFPFYTKYLAELIALDDNNNQYFITTHNPYFLIPLLEKTPKNEISVFLTYYKDYQTKIKVLSEKELQEILDLGIDVFFNIDRFLED